MSKTKPDEKDAKARENAKASEKGFPDLEDVEPGSDADAVPVAKPVTPKQ